MADEQIDPVTGFTHEEMKAFVRDHFEQFVNQKNINIGDVNFAPEFVDLGSDVPPDCPQGRRARSCMSAGRTRSTLTFMSRSRT